MPLSASSCDTSWSPARQLLTVDGKRIYVEVPTALSTARGTALIGSPTVGWMTRTNFIDTMVPVRLIDPRSAVGVTLDSHGAAVPLPRLKFASKPYSLLAVNDRGNIRLIWATTSDSVRTVLNLDSLWTSTLLNGSWTPPRSLAHGKRLRWFTNTATLTEMGGAPLAVLPMQDTTREPSSGILVLRRAGDRWERRWVATGPYPTSASVIAVDAHSIVLALTGEVSVGADRSPNGVFVARIDWRDTSQVEIRALRKSNVVLAFDPKLFRVGSSLHLVWLENARGHGGGDEFMEAISADEGVSWSSPSLTPLPAEYRGLSVAAAKNGRAFAVMINDALRELTLLVRDAQGWKVERTLSTSALTAPGLSIVNDSLVISFGSGLSSPEVRETVPLLMIATHPLRCDVTPVTPLHR